MNMHLIKGRKAELFSMTDVDGSVKLDSSFLGCLEVASNLMKPDVVVLTDDKTTLGYGN